MWLDIRTASTVDDILSNGKRNKNFIKNLCGLPISTYFSAVKIKWLMDNVKEVKDAMNENRCMFGTIDTWLLWVTLHLILFHRLKVTVNAISCIFNMYFCVYRI